MALDATGNSVVTAPVPYEWIRFKAVSATSAGSLIIWARAEGDV